MNNEQFRRLSKWDFVSLTDLVDRLLGQSDLREAVQKRRLQLGFHQAKKELDQNATLIGATLESAVRAPRLLTPYGASNIVASLRQKLRRQGVTSWLINHF
jgi:hypothetical protein